MSGPVGSSGTSISLSTFAVLKRLTAEGALVYLALVRTGEGDAEVFEFDNGAVRK